MSKAMNKTKKDILETVRRSKPKPRTTATIKNALRNQFLTPKIKLARIGIVRTRYAARS